MPLSLFLVPEKRPGGPPSLNTVGPQSPLFTVLDTNTHRRFLVDTGAQVSVIPASPADRAISRGHGTDFAYPPPCMPPMALP